VINRGGDGTGCCVIEVSTDTAKLTNKIKLNKLIKLINLIKLTIRFDLKNRGYFYKEEVASRVNEVE